MFAARWFLAVLIGAPVSPAECRLTPLSPAQPPPKVEEGERATESQTFQTTVFALAPENNTVHFFDSASRIRRIEPNGRVTTLAGNGVRTELVTPGAARENGLPAVSQIAFSRGGVLHFVATGRVYRVTAGGQIEVVAGTGRPGFNGESLAATETNLGTIVNIVFNHSDELLILDGFLRVRRLEPDGTLKTIAGSTRIAATAGFTGDNGPATEAALSSPRQVVPFRDGSFWIKDFSGRHLRLVGVDGTIRTINQNFEPTVNILLFPDGTPAAATANRVYPLRSNGNIETGNNPYPPFTGTPLAIASDGSLYYLGSTRPEQRNPLVRLAGTTQGVVMAGAPVAATVDGQAAPFGVWYKRNGTLLYAALLNGKFGILEARAGQSPRFLAGGGEDIGTADGKQATSLTIFGVPPFTVDGEDRIILADVNRRRILIIGTDGKVTELKNQDGSPFAYTTLGTFASLQRIAADNAGNIYWFFQGYTPTGGVFTAEINVWNRATGAISMFVVQGMSALTRLDDGTVVVVAGNGANFRSAYRMDLNGQGPVLGGLRTAPLTAVSRLQDEWHFVAAGRLFRGVPGRLQMLDLPALPSGTTFTPDFVVAAAGQVLVHLTDGGFYRIEDTRDCNWLPQPVIASDGIVSAASFGFANTISPRQIMTVYGSGFGPPESQGALLDGSLRAIGQQAPYPALTLGNFSGAIPNATLTGTVLPLLYADSRQVTLQAVATIPASGSYLLYFTWQGVILIHPTPVRIVTATPALFTAGGGRDGLALARNLEDGSAHSESNAVARGAWVQLFATGLGAMSSNLSTGEFAGPNNPPAALNPVEVLIGGEPAEVEFTGAIPGAIAGVYQIRVRVPETLEPGRHQVTITAAGLAMDDQNVHIVVW